MAIIPGAAIDNDDGKQITVGGISGQGGLSAFDTLLLRLSAAKRKMFNDNTHKIKNKGVINMESKHLIGAFAALCAATFVSCGDSSTAVVNSSSSQLSSSFVEYNCDTFKCVTTEYLNQEMLAAGEYGILLDARDCQVYRTVEIGDQVWMAQNLNYRYTQGTASLDSMSFCYDDDPSNCETYGRLYTWSAAMDSAAVFSANGSGCGYDVT